MHQTSASGGTWQLGYELPDNQEVCSPSDQEGEHVTNLLAWNPGQELLGHEHLGDPPEAIESLGDEADALHAGDPLDPPGDTMVAPGVFLTSPPGSRDMLGDVSQSNSANKNENELLLGFFVCN